MGGPIAERSHQYLAQFLNRRIPKERCWGIDRAFILQRGCQATDTLRKKCKISGQLLVKVGAF
jgi:hypothetical protein